MKAYAILLCAGSGKRMGESKNKVLLNMNGKSPVRRALDAINMSECFSGVVIAARQEDMVDIKKICANDENVVIVEGGKERQDSVYNAIKAVPKDADIISIHDAARCYTSSQLIKRCVDSAVKYGSGAAARRCVDTVKQIDGEEIISTLNRENIIFIETPQAFSAKIIKEAYERAFNNGIYGTDDCFLLEDMGLRPRAVFHDEDNFKLTYKSDINRRNDIMKEMRIGQGIDAHRLTENRRLILGGVEIPYEKGLLGHSDADVLIHAIMDSLLGAAGKRDIGNLFPDTDDEYKDISSMRLLKKVYEILKEEGWRIGNIDATVVAQRPKLSGFIENMQKNIASLLECEEDKINIKATTTEKMGYEGRGEGISANAVCLIER